MDPLDIARHLAEHGVPIFIAKPDPNSDTGYKFPARWQKTVPDPTVVDKWKEGYAIGAVMGRGVVDAIDLDPRNGGVLDEVPFPTSYGRQRTPSGGTHDLIASLGVRTKQGIQPGVDIQAGNEEGGYGFIFIPPTIRTSKVTGKPVAYEWEKEPDLSMLLIGGDTSGEALRNLIENRRRPTSEGLEYDGPPYDELPDNLKLQAEQHVYNIIEDWKFKLGTAAGWPEGERDAKGRGWEALARDAAWSLASLAACPWTALTDEEAEELYEQILPDVIAADKKCSNKWYDGLVDRASAAPAGQPPWWAQIFFDQTDVLRHIRQAAYSRGVSSMSLLASVLGRVLLRIPPYVTLPPVVGSRASLNLGFALVGDAGTTKSASDLVAEELLGEEPDGRVLPIGSGEGMIDAFLEYEIKGDELEGTAKKTNKLVLVDDPFRLFTVDEGETLARLMDRQGSTGGGLMRTALTGGTLGTTNVKAGGRNRRVAKGEYRLVLIADIHPEQSDVLLAGAGVGMPQRFLWMSAQDKEMPEKVEDMPEWPGPLDWEMPEQEIGDIWYPDDIKHEIRQTRLDVNHGHLSAREAHNNLTRLKVAYALAVLHGENKITDLWWKLAGRLSDASLRLQESCQERLESIQQNRVTSRVITEQRAMEAAVEDKLKHAVDAIVNKLKKKRGQEFTWRDIKPAYRTIQDLETEEIIEGLRAVNNVTVTKYEGRNGRPAWKFKYGKEPK